MHRQGLDYYFVHGLAGVLPWTLLLPLAIKDFKKQRALTVVVAGIFVIFSCIPSKEERYLLPWYPFAVLMLTAPLVRRFEVRWLRNASLAVLLLGLAAPPVYYGFSAPAPEPRVSAGASLRDAGGEKRAGWQRHTLPGRDWRNCGLHGLRLARAGRSTWSPRAPTARRHRPPKRRLRAIAAQRITAGKSFFIVVKEDELEAIRSCFPRCAAGANRPIACATTGGPPIHNLAAVPRAAGRGHGGEDQGAVQAQPSGDGTGAW